MLPLICCSRRSLAAASPPVTAGCKAVGGQVAAALCADGLCLPAGSNLTAGELARVVGVVQRGWHRV